MQSVTIPLPNGAMPRLTVFRGLVDGDADHFALTFENRSKGTRCKATSVGTDLLASVAQVRLHSSCLTGDMLGSMRCDCGPQLDDAIGRFSRDSGTIIYLQQEGRGIGLAQKIAAYSLQDQGADTFEANRRIGFADDPRDYRVAAQMLLALGLGTIRLLTNNPDKVAQLGRWGIKVVAVEPTLVSLNEHNRRYLVAKRDLAGHRLSLGTDAERGEERDGPAFPVPKNECLRTRCPGCANGGGHEPARRAHFVAKCDLSAPSGEGLAQSLSRHSGERTR